MRGFRRLTKFEEEYLFNEIDRLKKSGRIRGNVSDYVDELKKRLAERFDATYEPVALARFLREFRHVFQETNGNQPKAPGKGAPLLTRIFVRRFLPRCRKMVYVH
ncbi:MAG: hypothetical protein A3A98_03970 [Candidatus Staskawiczbacteria bacterium RIFCSPLOWO2_01_FULL_40_39]|uniref:Uncharacterized protein n=1 Tax=Candidatus Staskawiczbacteria bacterium RIFCSPHIGHO2_01_FULL_39_25 TaxID=1802202 RepID=A0A1G2HPH0_9BACT|nr:MAG: hypothetical protein A2730_03185 [Candidatus Staskawiczbacteria bacterium RIFCSPHIGHO2_01_FULL_39_25]OGZ73927.1 MAG: hypothetical protein A3A98_03970 [Candidatus Staskawiczbacteria bacterium RIFCSPLOWO2_01_FULL_40_39]OGZ76538.1 MAG: hypothetical protein A3I87_00275 [Candidatus Staskawiczbacteria bacterium RIFCSPLOWO2_02_FULL_39_8]